MRSIGRFLPVAALFGSAALLLVDLAVSPMFSYRLPQPDFYVYYLAARIGRAHGWGLMYDPSVFRPAITAAVGRYLPYLNPPLLAWIVSPLSWLPYRLAAWLWTGVLGAALVAAWVLGAPGGRARRLVVLVGPGAAGPGFS